MKKILLSLMMLGAFAVVKAQVVLNEVYGNPGGTNSEFIELYNSGASENLDCYTLLVYYEGENSADKGWFVIDFPNVSIDPVPGFFVLAPQNSFTTQGGPGTADLNWNDATFRSGATGGSIKQYDWNGDSPATYTSVPPATTITNLLDGTLSGGQYYFTLLYKDGILINAFVGGGADPDLTTYAPALLLGSLPIDMSAGCNDFDAFADLHAVEFFNPSGGSDNGYAREFDGKCGSWAKTAPGVNHTPGTTNGLGTGEEGSLTIAQFINCNDSDPAPGIQRTASADVTGISGTLITEDLDFPVVIRIFMDANLDSIPDGPAFALDTQELITDGAVIFDLPDNNSDYIISYQTARGCFDRQEVLINECSVLPVNLKSFNAARSSSNVNIVWETATEVNNYGFFVQRKIGSGTWQNAAFVPSQALDGNSFSELRYEFTDYNPTRAISQYRLRQVDIDYKSAFSTIRAVRGLAMRSNVIIYPNPTSDGKVNVVFEDFNVVRNVSVMDMNGRMIRAWKNVTNNNIQIDNLSPGFYSVRIENTETGEQTVEKIVVNKR